ncbi:hypothetical protein G7046_g2369 [Stylonectria norvegica]|nr:hypothetical protein G7046_g2369 [Stylonectria norvegica]
MVDSIEKRANGRSGQPMPVQVAAKWRTVLDESPRSSDRAHPILMERMDHFASEIHEIKRSIERLFEMLNNSFQSVQNTTSITENVPTSIAEKDKAPAEVAFEKLTEGKRFETLVKWHGDFVDDAGRELGFLDSHRLPTAPEDEIGYMKAFIKQVHGRMVAEDIDADDLYAYGRFRQIHDLMTELSLDLLKKLYYLLADKVFF